MGDVIAAEWRLEAVARINPSPHVPRSGFNGDK
jgi:hypothetical protein